jgi:hypothetical protein
MRRSAPQAVAAPPDRVENHAPGGLGHTQALAQGNRWVVYMLQYVPEEDRAERIISEGQRFCEPSNVSADARRGVRWSQRVLRVEGDAQCPSSAQLANPGRVARTNVKHRR